MKKNISLTIVLAILCFAVTAFAASNYVGAGDVVELAWATTSPSAGDAVVKGTAKATGAIIGVALNGTGTAAQTGLSIATEGIFDLSVTASSTVGSIAIGDYIYTPIVGIDEHTCVLSNITTGVLFGQALEAVTASTTAGVYSTVKVLLRQPGHL